MTFKTIWQPVPKWEIPVKKLQRSKFSLRRDEKKRERVDKNQTRKWIFMFDWDAEYASIVKFYAELALRSGWRDYVRDLVRQKMLDPVLKDLGKDVAQKIKELENDKTGN
jgi:3-methyladenine DNA glycosylase/8-oxoguanine DNA glycosylase